MQENINKTSIKEEILGQIEKLAVQYDKIDTPQKGRIIFSISQQK